MPQRFRRSLTYQNHVSFSRSSSCGILFFYTHFYSRTNFHSVRIGHRSFILQVSLLSLFSASYWHFNRSSATVSWIFLKKLAFELILFLNVTHAMNLISILSPVYRAMLTPRHDLRFGRICWAANEIG